MHEWSLIFSTGAQSENKKNRSSVSKPCLWVLGLVVVGVFFFFFFYFTHPISYPGLQLLAHAKGRQVFAPMQQSSAKTRHLSFPATEGSRARKGSEPCKGRSPLPAQCKLLEKSTEREAPPNPVNAESWLGRTRRCRGWRCLQCRKSSSGTRQHFEPTERLSMFVPCNVSWMCHTRGKGNPRL